MSSVKATQPTFRAFDSLRYLDVRRVGAAKRAEIELGELSIGSCHAVVVAQVRAGKVVTLKYRGGCASRSTHSARDARLSKIFAQAKKKLPVSKPPFRFPVALSQVLEEIKIGPITIWPWCIAISFDDGSICWWCWFDDYYICIGPSTVEPAPR